jgi:hypothetical protein
LSPDPLFGESLCHSAQEKSSKISPITKERIDKNRTLQQLLTGKKAKDTFERPFALLAKKMTTLAKYFFTDDEHYDNIPRWTLSRCTTFLSFSEATQRNLKGCKPTAAKIAVDNRLQELIDADNPSLYISPDDYHLVVNTFNTLNFVLETHAQGVALPLVHHGSSTAAIQDSLQQLYQRCFHLSVDLDHHIASMAAAAKLPASQDNATTSESQTP